jgi:hypothetical protein
MASAVSDTNRRKSTQNWYEPNTKPLNVKL